MSVSVDAYFPVRVTTIAERDAQPPVEGLRCFVLDELSEYVYTLGVWVLVVTAITPETQIALDAKQATLVSGTNIKTVNGNNLLGSGDVIIGGAAAWGSITGTLSAQTDLVAELALKAPIANPTFTGTFAVAAGAISNAALANSAVANLSGTNTGDNAVNTLYNTSTAGVGVSPTATQTDSVTHSLGRTPTRIRIYGMSQFTSNAAAVPTPFSIGVWCSSGNRCIYQAYNTAAITTTQAAATSTTFAINIQTGANSFVTGIIQNVGATTFDISWTETGTSVVKVYMWEAE